MLLAANAHSKLIATKSQGQPIPRLELTPSEISKDLQLTPRGRTQLVADRLWQAKSSQDGTGHPLLRAAKRHRALNPASRPSQVSVSGDMSPEPALAGALPVRPRAASCIPWLGEHKDDTDVPDAPLRRARYAATLACFAAPICPSALASPVVLHPGLSASMCCVKVM